MVDILKYSAKIKEETDLILYDRGLYKIFEKYGTAKFTGSYELDLMIKKDLDVTIVTKDISLEEFFNLGGEISSLLKPHSMFFRNTKVKPISKRPKEGYYWGVQFDDWKIDLWAIDEQIYSGSVRYIDSVAGKITEENKKTILELKYLFIDNKDYGSKFSSREVYEAVLNNGVKTVDEFYSYLKSIGIYI